MAGSASDGANLAASAASQSAAAANTAAGNADTAATAADNAATQASDAATAANAAAAAANQAVENMEEKAIPYIEPVLDYAGDNSYEITGTPVTGKKGEAFRVGFSGTWKASGTTRNTPYAMQGFITPSSLPGPIPQARTY